MSSVTLPFLDHFIASYRASFPEPLAESPFIQDQSIFACLLNPKSVQWVKSCIFEMDYPSLARINIYACAILKELSVSEAHVAVTTVDSLHEKYVELKLSESVKFEALFTYMQAMKEKHIFSVRLKSILLVF